MNTRTLGGSAYLANLLQWQEETELIGKVTRSENMIPKHFQAAAREHGLRIWQICDDHGNDNGQFVLVEGEVELEGAIRILCEGTLDDVAYCLDANYGVSL